MRLAIFFVFSVFLTFNFYGLYAQGADVRLIRSSREFHYAIDNSDTSKFGFIFEHADQAVGIRNLRLHGGYVYISDPYHGNIKKISIENGNIVSVSNKIDSINSLRNITVFNNQIYVFGFQEYVQVLNLELELIDKIEIKGLNHEKYIAGQSDSVLTFFRLYNFVLDKEADLYRVPIVSIDTKKVIYHDTLSLSKDEYYKSCFEYPFDHVRAFHFKTVNEYGIIYLHVQHQKYELKEKLPDTFNLYESLNIDYTDTQVGYFSVTPYDVKLTINNY